MIGKREIGKCETSLEQGGRLVALRRSQRTIEKRWRLMNRGIPTAVLLTGLAACGASHAAEGRHRDAAACVVEVLHSEELPGAPIFYQIVRARLRVTPPDQPPFETTVERQIPWQYPPPRQGQRLRLACDPERLSSWMLFGPTWR